MGSGEGAEVTLSIKSLELWSEDLHTDNDINENDMNNNRQSMKKGSF